MQKPVIVAATRTAIGTFAGTLSQIPAPELAAVAIREALRRAGNLPGDQVDEVILGNVLAAGLGLNPARVAYLKAGIPKEVPGYGINKACGSV
jgi:acetyl-CoA C-acetyltransferase